jgi:hypothetical protein
MAQKVVQTPAGTPLCGLQTRVKPVGSPNKRPTVKSLVTMPNGRSSKLSAKASESCSRVGRISSAEEILSGLRDPGLIPDVVTYRICKSQDAAAIPLELLSCMKKCQVAPQKTRRIVSLAFVNGTNAEVYALQLQGS